MVVAASKIDAAQTPERADGLEAFCAERGIAFFRISAVTGEGVETLKHHLGARIAESRSEAEATRTTADMSETLETR